MGTQKTRKQTAARKKKTAKKPATTKRAAKKKGAAGKKKAVSAKKSAAKKTRAKKKTTSGKTAATKKKSTRKRTSVKKKSVKKTTPKKKSTEKKGTARKTASKKASAKKKPKAENVSAKKAAAKKPTQKTTAKKKAAAKKPAQKKAAAVSKQPAKKKSAQKAASAAGTRARESAAQKAPAPRPKGKALPRQFLFELAQAIQEAVVPAARAVKGREIVDTAASGDATFELDRIAERALLSFLKAKRAPVAYYSEDSGYSTFSSEQPKHLLVVDPIDGTRAAKSGFEACVVAIASTRVIERPTIGDIDNACVLEILGDRVFYGERGKGGRMYIDGKLKRPKLSQNTNLETLTWSMTVPARPAELIFPTAARLIDLSSLKGGFFACNSTSYSLTRLLTNQMDGCVDFAGRYMHDIPDVVRDHFINAGRGVVLGIAPYDFAAALLIAQESGCVVTDAYGQGFDDVLLLDSSPANHQTLIAAANAELHEKLLSFFDTRIKQFEALLNRTRG